METEEKTMAEKLAEEAGRLGVLHGFAALFVVLGALAWLLEVSGLYDTVVKTSTLLFAVAATLVGARICSYVITQRMKVVYKIGVDKERAEVSILKDKLGWAKEHQKHILWILNSRSWTLYLESVAQNPTTSKHLEEFDQIIAELLEQMAKVRSLDKSGLAFEAISSRIIGDLKWALQYTRRAKAEHDAEGAWNARISKVAAALM